MSAGPSTAAARNHGGGGPTTGTMHHERAQVRVIRGGRFNCHTRPQQPPSWTRLFAIRERRARGTAVSEVMVGRSSDRTRGGLSGPPHPSKKPRVTTKISDDDRGTTRERRDDERTKHTTPQHTTARRHQVKVIASNIAMAMATPWLTTTIFATRAGTRILMRAGDETASSRCKPPREVRRISRRL